MSEVLFFSYSKDMGPLSGLQRLLLKSPLPDMIATGVSVAIKLHMGELGNIRYLRPSFVRTVVDMVRKRKGKPFLFDTVTAYPGERRTKEKYLKTAAKNGFVRASVNAPILIAGDKDDFRTIPITNPIDGCQLREAKIPNQLLQSAFMVVLSHVKGHELTGMGGAVKNLGMGCVSTETKRAQHYVNMPEFKEDSDCNDCGKCVNVCPNDAIEMIEGKPARSIAECTACGSCYFTCPERCWAWPPGSREKLQIYLGHAASAVVSTFTGKIAYVNFIQDVVPLCDCIAKSGKPVVQDVGIAFSLDPVAIDMASFDLIDQSPIIPGSTTVKPPDILGKMHDTNSLVQLQTAEKLRLGSMKYELVSI
ncbi:MAG: DUF362 domain-containing protein [Dehalococcoidia bacterium]|nr:MAG: DUF362 domain-containing protein [Dehalococcoidia bacterium]